MLSMYTLPIFQYLSGVQEPLRGGDSVADPDSGGHGPIHPCVPEHSHGPGGPRATPRHPAGTQPHHVHGRTQPGGRHATTPRSVQNRRNDSQMNSAGDTVVVVKLVVIFRLCRSQVSITYWRWTSSSVRCMTPISLTSCSMEIWRKLTSSSRSVLYLWWDATHTHTDMI